MFGACVARSRRFTPPVITEEYRSSCDMKSAIQSIFFAWNATWNQNTLISNCKCLFTFLRTTGGLSAVTIDDYPQQPGD